MAQQATPSRPQPVSSRRRPGFTATSPHMAVPEWRATGCRSRPGPRHQPTDEPRQSGSHRWPPPPPPPQSPPTRSRRVDPHLAGGQHPVEGRITGNLLALVPRSHTGTGRGGVPHDPRSTRRRRRGSNLGPGRRATVIAVPEDRPAHGWRQSRGSRRDPTRRSRPRRHARRVASIRSPLPLRRLNGVALPQSAILTSSPSSTAATDTEDQPQNPPAPRGTADAAVGVALLCHSRRPFPWVGACVGTWAQTVCRPGAHRRRRN